MSKRVMIVSPFTFLVVARTVFESYRNFMIGDQLKDVIKALDEFAKEWELFKAKFGKYGRSLDTLKNDYDELSGTRLRQLEKRLGKVRSFSSSDQLLDKTAADLPTLPSDSTEVAD
jgi:DNA anti-recombination protein RmuC